MTKTNKDSPGIGKCILIIFGILCMFGSKMIPPMFGLSVGGFQVMGTLIGGIMLLLIDTGFVVFPGQFYCFFRNFLFCSEFRSGQKRNCQADCNCFDDQQAWA